MWFLFGIILIFGFVVFFGAPYVPSKKRDLKRALTELYPIGKKDVLVDIGSGDGVVLREAVRLGAAKAVGFELNPVLVAVARWLSRRFKGVSTHLANAWHAPFPDDTTVVYVFTTTRDAGKMVRKIQKEATRLGHPLSVISYGCELPGKKPEKTVGAHLLYHFS